MTDGHHRHRERTACGKNWTVEMHDIAVVFFDRSDDRCCSIENVFRICGCPVQGQIEMDELQSRNALRCCELFGFRARADNAKCCLRIVGSKALCEIE